MPWPRKVVTSTGALAKQSQLDDSMVYPIYTVGHSSRTLAKFVEILHAAKVQAIVDIRRMPGSRAYPHFNSDHLARSLADFQVSYEYLPSLGGRRSRVADTPLQINAGWRNRSFHNYADYALSPDFRTGLERLIEAARTRPCAMMCSEAVWWRCHRRIVSDYLLARGEHVIHVMGVGRMEPARLTEGAVVRADLTVIYPPATMG
jgi:uncharacterized protein (DUF488 family)